MKKFFGSFTDCQIGKNDFNEEGVFSVLIQEQDLKNRKFDDCEFYWSQS